MNSVLVVLSIWALITPVLMLPICLVLDIIYLVSMRLKLYDSLYFFLVPLTLSTLLITRLLPNKYLLN